ncbi:spermidine/putrescine transport system permease protein [Clostridium collagenovorans DSM 3089]|uniref:Spermidine/putrescine transport system permease protein n=1 Tax=Clostridium collagenovorans DSM 3089 TaxID=1121306 RepID=A0A1M5TRL2_9CLOT|nr:ABC transporter permease [Clostridium collagenovorans]SHH53402.1 spermidine/putrescine transport system permease protein [Clostridium collagenovorans DSM 3089]
MVKKYGKRLYAFLVFLFLYAPIIVLIVFSFNDSKSRANWNGFTLKWYIELFKDTSIMKSLYYTLLVGVLSAFISTVLGTLAAFGIHSMKGFKRKLLINLNYLPVLNADIVTAVGLMILFNFIGLQLGFLSMLLAHVTFCTPYVVLSVLPRLKQLPKNTMEAALDLGATPFYALTRVIIPQIKPGIIAGALMAFSLSIDDFVISFFTTGQGVTNLSISIFSMARRGINPKINALSTLMFLAVIIILLIVNRKASNEGGKK